MNISSEIIALSMSMHNVQLQNAVDVSVMKQSMETEEQAMEMITSMLPYVGQNVDVYA